jgi:hypothetical protein
MEELKKELMDALMDLRANSKAVLEVAPNALPPQLRTLLQVPQVRLQEDFDKMIEVVPEEEQESFLSLMVVAVGSTMRAYSDLRESLDRRIQPEGEERTKPRKFQGFKKRKGTW